MVSTLDGQAQDRRLYPPHMTHAEVGRRIALIPLDFPEPRRWFIAFVGASILVGVLITSVFWLFLFGTGVWGLNNPVYWGVAIASYVWWISMAHAGTMISALLLLLNQGWRNSLNRFAEAMTVFAVVQAGLMPILHLGRPWLFYWLFPYPNTMEVWPQFKSPLAWDVFGVTAYLLVSLTFFYVGLIPDLASVRDRAKGRTAQRLYGLFALGWRGSAKHWRRWQLTYWTAGALTVTLVMMVESTVSLLFAGGIVPGWHTTIYPPFFLLGAIYEGFAVVTLLAIALRAFFRLDDLITIRHLDLLARMMLTFGHLAMFCWLTEQFSAWYSGHAFERATLYDRWFGAYAGLFWTAALFSYVALQALWFVRLRRHCGVLAIVAALGATGVWLEHFMELTSSLYRDYLPAAWGMFWPSVWEWALLAGTIGLFLFLFLLFVRFLPLVSLFEVREVLEEERPRA